MPSDSGVTGVSDLGSGRTISVAYQPHPDREENVRLARFAYRLAQYTGDPEEQHTATQALRYLATSDIATADFSAPALLAQREFTHPSKYLTCGGLLGRTGQRNNCCGRPVTYLDTRNCSVID